MQQVKKFWEYGAGRTVLAAFCAHSVSISIGICQGYSAILIPQLNYANTHIRITPEESSWLASLGAVTNPIGSILSGLLAEYLGRKRAIQLTTVPFAIGWLCIGMADSIELLYTGRLISGIAAGMSSASYTYVSEISTPENRGILQSLGPICASFGILLTYTLGYCMHWARVAFASLVFCFATLVSVQFLPESPAHLYKIGEIGNSFDGYLWLRRNNALAQQEIEGHSTVIKPSAKGSSWGASYLSPATVKPFMILVTLFFLQELSGIYTILFYAVSFFEQTGLRLDNYVSSIIVATIRFLMALVAAILIKSFGRKILCMTSSFGMSVTMLMMALFFKYYELYPSEVRVLPFLPLICVVFNVMFSMIGMLPIPWILVGELFPLEVRSIMSGVVICIAQCFVFICVKIYPDLIDLCGFSGTLGSFFVAAVAAMFFCKFVLPETKNRSLQEIERYFRFGDGGKGEASGGCDNKGFVIGPEKDEIYAIVVT